MKCHEYMYFRGYYTQTDQNSWQCQSDFLVSFPRQTQHWNVRAVSGKDCCDNKEHAPACFYVFRRWINPFGVFMLGRSSVIPFLWHKSGGDQKNCKKCKILSTKKQCDLCAFENPNADYVSARSWALFECSRMRYNFPKWAKFYKF